MRSQSMQAYGSIGILESKAVRDFLGGEALKQEIQQFSVTLLQLA